MNQNVEAYDKERIMEWKERKFMRTEDAALREKFIEEESFDKVRMMNEQALDKMKFELNQKFDAQQVERAIEKENMITQLIEAA